MRVIAQDVLLPGTIEFALLLPVTQQVPNMHMCSKYSYRHQISTLVPALHVNICMTGLG